MLLAVGKVLQVHRFVAQTRFQRFLPSRVFGERMIGILADSLKSETHHVYAITSREIQFESVRRLQKFDGEIQHLLVGKRQVIVENRHLVFARRMAQRQRGLQAAEDVVWNLVGGFVLVHSHGTTEIWMSFDRDAGDDRLDIPPVIEERCQAGPRLFVHAVAFIEHANTATDHGGDHRRSVVGNLSVFRQHGCHQQIFRASVGRALVDEKFLFPRSSPRHRQRCLTNSRCPDNTWSQWQIAFVDNQPAGQKLFEDFVLTDPRTL